MNLGEIRAAIFSQADWAPKQSLDAKTRVNEFINRAYFQLTQEAPFLFFEKRVGFATINDETPDTTAIRDATGNPAFPADTVDVVGTDPWVLQRTLNNTVAGMTLWDLTGRWRGREIILKDSTGTDHRRTIRDIWNHDVGGGVLHQRISLYRPWNNDTDTLLEWRIYSEDYYLPDNVIEVNSIRLFKQNQNWPLDIVGQMEAEYLSFADSPVSTVGGLPRTAFRRYHKQIESPTLAPVPSINGAWIGPEPAGEFQYVYTYCWGYRDGDFRDFGPEGPYSAAQATPARREPLWESGPSPLAAATALNDDTNGRVLVGLPDIDYMQGFGRNADARYHHSGWRKRIYRRRLTVNSVGYSGGGGLPNQLGGALNQETPDAFYLIGDIDGWNITFVDDGSILPDYHRRLRDIHGYESVRFYPRPNERYQVEVRCLLRPEELKDDQDVPEIHPDGIDVLLYRALGFLYEADGNIDLADRAIGRFREALFTLTKRYGDLRYPGEALMKKPARAGRIIDTRRAWRRWYNLPSS